MQRFDDLGLNTAKLTKQEFSKQCVIAVPLSPTIERDHEQTRSLKAAQLLLPTGFLEDGITQRSTHLIKHCGTPQKSLELLGQTHQQLVVQVVGHIPILTRDRQGLAVAVARDHRSEVEADRPPFGPFGHDRCPLTSEVDVCRREDLLRTNPVKCQIPLGELQRLTGRPQPRQIMLLGTTRRHQLRPARNPRDHDA